MSSRGQLGGLSAAAPQAVRVLEGAGCEVILVETVGVGQAEVEIASLADTTLVLLAPGMGDAIQAVKAGVLEIADVFVINKADRPGADKVAADLDAMMGLVPQAAAVRPPVFRTIAVSGEGIPALRDGLMAFVAATEGDRRAERRRERAEMRFLGVLVERFVRDVRSRILPGARFQEIVSAIAARRIDPYTAADDVLHEGEKR